MSQAEADGAGARMEAALRRAARLYVRRLRVEEDDHRRRGELAAVLARLGWAPPEGLAAGLQRVPAESAEAEALLRRELARLSRAARGAGPGYDLNRHIAVRRALAQLLGLADERPNPLRNENQPGRELNRRFGGGRARRSARG